MGAKKKYDVFISFDRSNSELKAHAKDFYSKLKEMKYSVFPVSNQRQKKIEEALQESDSLLLLCNVHSKAADEVRKECKFYAENNKQGKVFIFKASGFETEHIPVPFRNRKDIPFASTSDKQIKNIEEWRPEKVQIETNTRAHSGDGGGIKKIIKWVIASTGTIILGVISAKLANLTWGQITSFFGSIIISISSFFSCSSDDPPSLEFAVKDTTIYADNTLNLQDLLIVEPDSTHRANVTWKRYDKPITETELKGQLADSGKYYALITYPKWIFFTGTSVDSLMVHVKDPCERLSVKINSTKTTYNAPIALKTIEVIVSDDFDKGSINKKWRTDNGKDNWTEVSSADKTGKYVVTVTDKFCKEGKSDTIHITIEKGIDSLYWKPPTRKDWNVYVKGHASEIEDLTPDQVFSIYISDRNKIWNETEFDFFMTTIKSNLRAFPTGSSEDYVIIFNKVGRIMTQFPRGKYSAKTSAIDHYKKKGYKLCYLRLNL